MNFIRPIYDKLSTIYRFVKTYSQHLPMAAKAIGTLTCTILMIRGTPRGSGSSIVILYVGRRWNEVFLTDLIFEDQEVISRENLCLFSAHARSDLLGGEADIKIVDVGWPYDGAFKRKAAYLEFADWINMSLPLEDEWAGVVRTFRHSTRNNDLRLIRRNEYHFEVTNDVATIEAFYDNMYLPSVSRRHGNSSIIAPRKHVLKRARQGKLLQVFREDQLVIAGVVYPEGDVLHFLWQGAPTRFHSQPAEGAASALYYFGIRYAFENEIGEVDFSGTRPFLDFGDFRFKRKWGAYVDDSFSPNSVLLRPLNNHGKTISFFEQFPLIVRRDDGLEAVIVRRADTVNSDTLRQVHKYYNCDGLVRIVVICVSDEACTPNSSHEFEGSEIRVIRCHREQFSRIYVSNSLMTRKG